MSLINYSDVTGQILDAKDRDTVNLHNGYYLREAVGYAKITNTLQSNIPVFLPSQAQAGGELVTNPDRRLILPVGAIISRMALRLPRIETNRTTQYGNLPVGTRLIGTTGELVKLSADAVFTTIDPAITAAANSYTPDASRTVQSPSNAAAGIVPALTVATSYSVVVSNAGSTAAGTGISVSSTGVDAFAIVQICWYEIQPAPNYEVLGYQSRQKGN